MGVEPQPKFEEIEKRFELEFTRLRDIEDVNLQDQRRKTLMFQYEHELERERKDV
jgi:hypothetical protein